ncbi:MAG: hydrolase [Pyrinomonadaceae bacterium]
MHHANTLDLTRSALIIVDMQEAFRSKIENFDKIATRISVMVRGAQLLAVPVLATEQYPKGLGHTAAEISDVLPSSTQMVEKTAFSSCGADAFMAQLQSTNARQLLVAGIEAHICVNQTVHDLLASGYQVHVLTDCISSRKKMDRKAAFAKMQLSGAVPSSVEMALFELMRDARHEQFREIQRLIK